MRGFCAGVCFPSGQCVCYSFNRKTQLLRESTHGRYWRINLGLLPNNRRRKIIDENREEMESLGRRKDDVLCRYDLRGYCGLDLPAFQQWPNENSFYGGKTPY